jgi:hypothetical protein
VTAVEGRVRSIQDRLVQVAKRRNAPHTEILQNYGLERFLYRLSRSPHAGRFVLKGALVLQIWQGVSARPTRDIDLLGPPSLTADELARILAACLSLDGGDDGVMFTEESLSVASIRAQAEDVGFRVKLDARLGTSRLRLQVDVGVGDTVTPDPVFRDYPTLLDLPAPRQSGTRLPPGRPRSPPRCRSGSRRSSASFRRNRRNGRHSCATAVAPVRRLTPRSPRSGTF